MFLFINWKLLLISPFSISPFSFSNSFFPYFFFIFTEDFSLIIFKKFCKFMENRQLCKNVKLI